MNFKLFMTFPFPTYIPAVLWKTNHSIATVSWGDQLSALCGRTVDVTMGRLVPIPTLTIYQFGMLTEICKM